MVDIVLVEQLVSIGSGIATIIVIYFLWKAIKQMDESVKVGRIQLQYRFRPWVGPSSGIELMGTTEGKQQFVIKLRNYGELPASNVLAKFIMKNQEPTRDILKNSELVDSFNLGPLLPNMEKRYWFFIDSDLLHRAKDNNDNIFIALYFAYEFGGGRSGYGMISHFDSNANAFVHIDMWTD